MFYCLKGIDSLELTLRTNIIQKKSIIIATMDDLQKQKLTSSSCVKVFIQRDYSDGVGVRFDTKLPADLRGKIDQAEFEDVLERINGVYAEAERLSARTCFENCFACLTAYLVLICIPTNYEKNVKKASELISMENDRLFIPRGLLMVDPMERGLRCVSFLFLKI